MRSGCMLPFRRDASPDWPALLGSAAIGAAAGILIAGNLFTEGKKIRKQIVAPYRVGDDAFVRSMGLILGPPILDGNTVKSLHNGEQIFPAMLEAIRGAQRTVCFENFIFYEGEVTERFGNALAERARAGVKVHFLQDGLGCDCHFGRDICHMERSGVEVEIYRFTHLTRVNQRTHRKLLIVDGEVGFTGGVGIADCWDGRGDRPNEWRDSHYELRGPCVAQMQQAFIDNWMMTRGEVLHGDEYSPALGDAGNLRCQVFKSSADEGSDSARVMVMISLAAAKETVRIANAYFLPDDLTIATILSACHRGVEVEIIVPGEQIDQPWFRQVARQRWGKMLEAGVRFYEFQPTNFHCKYMVADDCWVSVGSTNMDNRSLRLNEECNLNVLDSGFAAEHVRLFEADKKQSRRISVSEWKRRPLLERIAGTAGLLFRGQM